MDTSIQPTDFYSNDSEKTKFNWFCYEFASELYINIDAPLRKKLSKHKISENKIINFCIYYSKSLKTPILNKLNGKSADMVLSDDEIFNYFGKIDTKSIDCLFKAIGKSWNDLMEICCSCPTRCISERNNICELFDE